MFVLKRDEGKPEGRRAVQVCARNVYIPSFRIKRRGNRYRPCVVEVFHFECVYVYVCVCILFWIDLSLCMGMRVMMRAVGIGIVLKWGLKRFVDF